MESKTKRILSTNELQNLVTQNFGHDITLKQSFELSDGMYNTAYLLLLSDGQEVILKVAPPETIKTLRYEKNIMDTEVTIMQYLYDESEVPVPRIITYDISKELVDCPYFIMEKLEGKPYNKVKEHLKPEQKAHIEQQLGRYNRFINEVQNDLFGYCEKDARKSKKWSEAILHMFIDLLEDAKDFPVDLPEDSNRLLTWINEHAEILDEITEASLVHWDLWDGNVFVDEQNQITGIVDFERALWGDPLMEAYLVPYFGDRTNFCIGYGREVEFTANEEIRRRLYNVYLSLIMVIEYYYRGYTDPGHKEWVHNTLASDLKNLLY